MRSLSDGLARSRAFACLSGPLAAPGCVETQRGPLVLEPVGFDQPRLAPEAEPFEEPMDGHVAVVSLGVDAVDVVLVEQPRANGAERLCRQAAASCALVPLFGRR